MSVARISNASTSTTTTTNQACAACKYQRRKCTSDCLLAPYFPHYRTRQFLNAHKLFGVSNITKILKNLSPADKDIAMLTIIFESDARAVDPVGGCYAIVCGLQQQIEYRMAQLELVKHQLESCRAQAAYAQHDSHFQEKNAITDDSTACDQLVVNPESLEIYDGEDRDQIFQYQDYVQEQHQLQPSSNEEQEIFVVQEPDHLNMNLDQLQESSLQEEQVVSTWSLQEPSVSSTSTHSLNVKQQLDFVNFDMNRVNFDMNDVNFEPGELVDRKFVSSSAPRLVTSS